MVVEVVTFRLAAGVDEKAFRAADERAQTGYFYLQRGIVRRTTARGADGEWLVLTFWDSAEDAEAAAAPDDYMAFVDRSTFAMKRYASLD